MSTVVRNIVMFTCQYLGEVRRTTNTPSRWYFFLHFIPMLRSKWFAKSCNIQRTVQAAHLPNPTRRWFAVIIVSNLRDFCDSVVGYSFGKIFCSVPNWEILTSREHLAVQYHGIIRIQGLHERHFLSLAAYQRSDIHIRLEFDLHTVKNKK